MEVIDFEVCGVKYLVLELEEKNQRATHMDKILIVD